MTQARLTPRSRSKARRQRTPPEARQPVRGKLTAIIQGHKLLKRIIHKIEVAHQGPNKRHLNVSRRIVGQLQLREQIRPYTQSMVRIPPSAAIRSISTAGPKPAHFLQFDIDQTNAAQFCQMPVRQQYFVQIRLPLQGCLYCAPPPIVKPGRFLGVGCSRYTRPMSG